MTETEVNPKKNQYKDIRIRMKPIEIKVIIKALEIVTESDDKLLMSLLDQGILLKEERLSQGQLPQEESNIMRMLLARLKKTGRMPTGYRKQLEPPQNDRKGVKLSNQYKDRSSR